MKCNQSFLTRLLVCYLFMVTAVADASEGSRYFTLTIVTNTSFSLGEAPGPFFQQKDTTIPKTLLNELQKAGKDTSISKKELQKLLKTAQDAAAKAKPFKVEAPKTLLQKIGDAFKFKSNSEKKEEERVMKFLKPLVHDSLAITTKDVQEIQSILSRIRDTTRMTYDSLMLYIKKINNRPSVHDTTYYVNKDAPIPIEETNSKIITDKDIQDLADKVLPLIDDQARGDLATKERRTTLALFHQIIANGPDTVYAVPDKQKGVVKRFRLQVKNKADVYGIYNYNTNSNYRNYKFSFLNTLIYNSLFVNGTKGNIKEDNGWSTNPVITLAKKANCNIVFTAAIQQEGSTETFLNNNRAARQQLVHDVIALLKLRGANGVNIQFNGVHNGNEPNFTGFIKYLSDTLKATNPNYTLFITVPANRNTAGYNMVELAKYADRFLLDFSYVNESGPPGPIAPLKSKGINIEDAVTNFVNSVPPQVPLGKKLIVGINYKGSQWLTRPNAKGRYFLQTLSYADIRNRHNWPNPVFNETSASVIIDSLNKKKTVVTTIYYDDERSLEKKYDYVTESKLGGISINALGDDSPYPELWETLLYKMGAIDTTHMPDSTLGRPLLKDLTYLERLRRYTTLFNYVLNNPCEICFESNTDSAGRIGISQDLQELKIDSIVIAKNLNPDLKDKYHSNFEYINRELSDYLGYLCLLILIITLAFAGLYLYKIKSEGEDWAWKKKVELLLIGLCLLLVLSSFTYFFTTDAIPFFGSSPKSPNRGYSEDIRRGVLQLANQEKEPVNKKQLAAFKAVIDSTSNVEFCAIDPNDDCVNVPLTTIMILTFVGMLLGFLITRYLIMPLLKRNDIP